jgi:neutral trehalase
LEDTKSKRVLQLMEEKIQNKWLSPNAWSPLVSIEWLVSWA